jgi:glucose/arabinose dehydrogenase
VVKLSSRLCWKERIAISFVFVLLAVGTTSAQSEEDYYRILTLPIPMDPKLEVSGLAVLPDGRIAVAIRKGEVWIVHNVYDDPPTDVIYKQFAGGLHEPLGLAYKDGDLYLVQRTELTRLRDTDKDGRADEYLTVAKGWGVTGNYHEYAYGPKFDRAGSMWITLNSGLGKKPHPDDDAWRGWSLKVSPDGSWKPVSGGMRSPSGLGINAQDDAFYTDQQGNWVPTNTLSHMREGVFHGYVDALKHCRLPGATFSYEGEIPQELSYPEAAERIPPMKLPAIWFPYRKVGMSATDVVLDSTEGKFGPFAGQLFVGDFTLSLISRVYLEKVNGEYQGACFLFREGFESAVVRMAFGDDGSMLVGMTNRGWNSLGTRSYGLQRLVWNGRMPFEIKTFEARPDGFELSFTKKVNVGTAVALSSYQLSSYTYRYHQTYGSPEIDTKLLRVESVTVAPGGRRLRLRVDGLREGYVHELYAEGVRSADGEALLHPRGYYTLNQIPD